MSSRCNCHRDLSGVLRWNLRSLGCLEYLNDPIQHLLVIWLLSTLGSLREMYMVEPLEARQSPYPHGKFEIQDPDDCQLWARRVQSFSQP
mmetsp:Transcript_124508/g.357664  ORF Transcript_124508/g.357664 Transcript_124508/m.357664 type:complete len:90 (-) Transcript_124508:48-317(-)